MKNVFRGFSTTRFIAVCFAFVVVFSWLYLYIPMLLGINSMGEPMALISANESAFFSIGGVFSSFGKTWFGIVLCLVFGFFFLDLRRMLPLLVVTLATSAFLSRLSFGNVIRVDPGTFNSLFVFVQFVTFSTPFILMERYIEEGDKSWKALLRSRFHIQNRISALKSSLKPFGKELLWVLVLVGLGRLPLAFTKGAGYVFLGSYFIDAGVVFFYSFFVSSTLIIFTSEDRCTLRHTLLSLVLLCFVLVFVLLFLPLMLSVGLALLYSIFSDGGVQASIVHAPGTAYFISFFSFKTFLYSGSGGLVHLAGFLIAIYTLVSRRLRKLEWAEGKYSVPALIFYLLIIGIFGWITSGHFASGGLTFSVHLPQLKAKEKLLLKKNADSLLVHKNRVIIITTVNRALKIYTKTDKKRVAYIRLPFIFPKDLSSGDIWFRIGTPRIIGSTLYLAAYSRKYGDKDPRWFLSGYAVSLKSNKIVRSWQVKTEKENVAQAIVKIGGRVLFLFNNRTTGKLECYTDTGRLFWKSGAAGTTGHTRMYGRGRIIVQSSAFYRRLHRMESAAIRLLRKKTAPAQLVIFNPGSGSVTVIDSRTGRSVKNRERLAKSAPPGCLIASGGKGYSIISAAGHSGKEVTSKVQFDAGYYEDETRFYGLDKWRFSAFEKKTGKTVWSVDMEQSSLVQYDIILHRDIFYIIRSDTCNHETTVMLVDKTSGRIRSRFFKKGFTHQSVWMDKKGVLYLALQFDRDSDKSRIIEVRFEPSGR